MPCPTRGSRSPYRLRSLLTSTASRRWSWATGAADLYAYHLATGTSVPGWPTTNASGPIDSTPSASSLGSNRSTVLVGSGDDADPTTGGYTAFGPNGRQRWFTKVVNPASDTAPLAGVQAGVTVGILQGRAGAVAGSLGQVSYALDAVSGTPMTGWPFFNSDSTHSTAALADLYGTGQSQIIVGGDQSAGEGRGRTYTNGGHIRILSAQGGQICRADTNQVVDSSPRWAGSSGVARQASWWARERSSPAPPTPTRSRPTTGIANCSGRPGSTAAPTPRLRSPMSSGTDRCRSWRAPIRARESQARYGC